jgi:two-component system, LytTR family, response regulator
MIRVVLVDDENHSRSSLEILIQTYCKDLEILSSFSSPLQAVASIQELLPDLIFLDIEMPGQTGFEVIEQIKHLAIPVIFTTAYQQYAIRAIKYSALDYLLKPINPEDLMEAVQRFRLRRHEVRKEQFQFFIDQLEQKNHTLKKLAVPNLDGFRLVPIDAILYLKADDNYTHIILRDKQTLLASRTLKEIQSQLEEYEQFVRIHNSYLVNVHEIIQYQKGEGGSVILSDQSVIPISRARKDSILNILLNRNEPFDLHS